MSYQILTLITPLITAPYLSRVLKADGIGAYSYTYSLVSYFIMFAALGNYVWLAKIDKLNRVKEYLYSKTDTAERIRKLGWNAAEGIFAFGNGIFFASTFNAVDDLGIVRGINGKAFYIPATSKIYLNNTEIFQFERLMVHENRNGIKLHDYVGRLMEVFGENASVAFCYLLATLFRDIIFRRTRHFPILNLFGEKGTGKTTLATSLQSFFLHGRGWQGDRKSVV